MIIPATIEQWVAIVPEDVKPHEVQNFKPLVVIAWDIEGNGPPVAITREGYTFHERDEILIFGNCYRAVEQQIDRMAKKNQAVA